MHTLLPSSCVCQGEARAEPDLQTISARLLAAPEAAFPPVCRAHVPLVTTLTRIESGKNRALACPSARQRERNGRATRATPRPPVCFLTSEPPLALRRRETICLSFASISRCACAKSACSLWTWTSRVSHFRWRLMYGTVGAHLRPRGLRSRPAVRATRVHGPRRRPHQLLRAVAATTQPPASASLKMQRVHLHPSQANFLWEAQHEKHTMCTALHIVRQVCPHTRTHTHTHTHTHTRTHKHTHTHTCTNRPQVLKFQHMLA